MKKTINYAIIKNIILLVVFLEIALFCFFATNKIVDLKGRVDKLETQIIQLQGDK